MKIVTKTQIRAGQARAYQDSVYEYVIETTPGTNEEAWELFQTVKPAKHRKDSASHKGACAFEFGLSSYGSLRQLKDDGTSWRYTVTYPYCD